MENQDKLPHKFTMWTAFIKENHIMDANEYENSLKEIASFDNWTTFWKIFQHVKKPSQLPLHCELFFFKKGIKPVWENKANVGGGKFVLRVKKNHADLVWEKLLLQSFIFQHKLYCGIVVISKRNEIDISIWIKEIEKHLDKQIIKDWIRQSLNINDKIYIEYKEHPLVDNEIQIHDELKDFMNL